MRRSLGFFLVSVPVWGLTLGCSDSTTLEGDSGGIVDAFTPPSDAFVGADAGTDAASLVDTGVVLPDGGHDAGPPHDAGTVLPPLDGGNPFGDSGALGDPAWVPLTVLTDGTHCTPLVPCGGDITGTWDVGGGCFEVPLGDVMRCPGAHATGSGRSRGRVTFDGTIAHRVAQSEVDVIVTIPSLCANFAGGCTAIETMIRASTPDAACATETDTSCLCQVRVTNVIDDTDGYTTMSNEIIGAGSGKHWAYCVAGDSLEYQDVSSTGTREPGIIDLTRR